MAAGIEDRVGTLADIARLLDWLANPPRRSKGVAK
jgi:hypothetical protein